MRTIGQRCWKILFFAGLTLAFLGIGLIHHWTVKDIVQRRKRFTTTVHFFAKMVLRLFNVTVIAHNIPQGPENHLIVLNHLGFLDDFIIAGTMPTMFVTSVEMRETPIMGLLSELAGCVYVEARDRSNIENEMKDIESALNQGFNVVLYPEGKTTNGEMVHPFKKTLLMSCAQTTADLLPAVINFRSVNGEEMQHKWRDFVFWYKRMPILKVLWNVAAIQSCMVELEFLHVIPVKTNSDRRVIAAQAQIQVDQKYRKIPLPASL